MGWPTSYVVCACGKRGWVSRKVAKAELRRCGLRHHGMSTYQCTSTDSGLWHWGHLPPPVKEGRLGRADIGPAAPRKPWRRAVSEPPPGPTLPGPDSPT